jgi:putative ABC transport system substrate-binding protein
MLRREVITLIGCAAAWPLRARAQQPMPVIGYLSSTSPGSAAPYVASLRQGLAETGYIEGQNLGIEYRWAEGRYDRLPALAADFVSRKVDVIIAPNINAALAAKGATSTISIVFITSDAVEEGWSPVLPSRAAISPASASSSS